MRETSKATARRRREICWLNDWSWPQVFSGVVLDVGPGDDPLIGHHWSGITRLNFFDKQHGDANKIDTYFDFGDKSEEAFNCIHGSQVLEHLHDPIDALKRMLKITKVGGWIVMTVPSVELYEKNMMPSRFNPDHKSTFSLWQVRHPTSFTHVFVPSLRHRFPQHKVWARLVDTNYDYMESPEIDQTLRFEDGVECWIEMVIRKGE